MKKQNLSQRFEKLGLRGVLARPLLGVFLFSSLGNLLMLSVPLYMLQIYDRVLISRSVETLVVLTGLVLFFLSIWAIMEIVRARILARVSARTDDQITYILTENALTGGHFAPGTTPLLIRDCEMFRRAITPTTLGTICDAIWAPAFIAIVFVMHPVLGYVALGTLIFLIAFSALSDWITRHIDGDGNARMARGKGLIASAAQNLSVVRAMGMGPKILTNARENILHGRLQEISNSDRRDIFINISRLVRMMAQVGILGFGAWLVIGQEITAGVMIAASMIMGRGLAPAEKLIGCLAPMRDGLFAFKRLSDALPPLQVTGTHIVKAPPIAAVLKLENIHHHYPQARDELLRGINLHLEPGQKIGIIGPNSAGKSTLASILVGALPPSAGVVSWGEKDMALISPQDKQGRIGYLPQSLEILDATVAENICGMATSAFEDAVDAAKLVGIHEAILTMPDGYDTMLGTRGIPLSGGRAQAIGLARAICRKPELVVLDEPNTFLDGPLEAGLSRVVETLAQSGSAIVVISHKPTLMGMLDTLYVLQDGKFRLSGPPEEVHGKILRRPPPSMSQMTMSNWISGVPK